MTKFGAAPPTSGGSIVFAAAGGLKTSAGSWSTMRGKTS